MNQKSASTQMEIRKIKKGDRAQFGFRPGDSETVEYDGTYVSVDVVVGRLCLLCLENAGHRGNQCAEVIVIFGDRGSESAEMDRVMNDISPFLDALVNLAPNGQNPGTVVTNIGGCKVYLNFRDSNEVFPAAPDFAAVFKPLKSEPKKWTKPLVIRALVNAQVQDCKFSDDIKVWSARSTYDWRAEYALQLAKRVFYDRHNWDVRHHAETGRISVNFGCTGNRNSFVVHIA